MFEEMVVSNPKNKPTNKPWTVIVSMALQVAFLAILILIPLIYTEALPRAMMSSILLAPPPPPPPPPPPAPAQIVHIKPVAHLMEAGKLVAPKVIPKDVKIIKEEEQPPDMGAGIAGGVPGGVAGGSMGGVIGGVIGGAGAAGPPAKAERVAHTSWWCGTKRQAGQPRSATLSAAGAPDAHQWHRETACHHRQDRRGGAVAGCLRPSVAGASCARRRQAVALSAYAAQRRTGGR